jgi:uncharacterized phiE125 gp8 family phage protein
MKTKLYAAPSIEPVTLAELKAHLRIETSGSFSDDVAVVNSIAPGSHVIAAGYTLAGTGVLVTAKQVLVILNAGANGTGGTVDVKIQESDDNATWTDVTSGAFTQVTEATDNAVYEKAYTGLKAYVRAVATVATASCEFSVDVVTGSANTSEDTWLTTVIKEARQAVEKVLGRAFIQQTWDLALDEWPEGDRLELPYPPLSSVTSVSYYDTAQTVATMSSSDYIVDTYSEPGLIVLGYGLSWPTVTLRPVNGIVIRFVAGHGAAASAVPETYRKQILMLCAHLYEHREETAERALESIALGGGFLGGLDRIARV